MNFPFILTDGDDDFFESLDVNESSVVANPDRGGDDDINGEGMFVGETKNDGNDIQLLRTDYNFSGVLTESSGYFFQYFAFIKEYLFVPISLWNE